MNLLNPLDPNAVVGDVEVIEDVSRLIVSEDLMDGQQAFQDKGLTWNEENHSAD